MMSSAIVSVGSEPRLGPQLAHHQLSYFLYGLASYLLASSRKLRMVGRNLGVTMKRE